MLEEVVFGVLFKCISHEVESEENVLLFRVEDCLIFMEKETAPKEFIQNFLRTVNFQTLEATLDLEQLGKMNEILTVKYDSLVHDTSVIEKSLKCILEDYQLSETVLEEVKEFSVCLDELENSINLLDELTGRIEGKLRELGKLK